MYLKAALRTFHNDILKTSKVLGIARSTVYQIEEDGELIPLRSLSMTDSSAQPAVLGGEVFAPPLAQVATVPER